ATSLAVPRDLDAEDIAAAVATRDEEERASVWRPHRAHVHRRARRDLMRAAVDGTHDPNRRQRVVAEMRRAEREAGVAAHEGEHRPIGRPARSAGPFSGRNLSWRRTGRIHHHDRTTVDAAATDKGNPSAVGRPAWRYVRRGVSEESPRHAAECGHHV